ncbi:hypothetical protein DFH06DRAFT_1386091 [Mycena polygramma]|nr:hypothetical protein DFH06DRAFT_1386091 [Mycena polygramma]
MTSAAEGPPNDGAPQSARGETAPTIVHGELATPVEEQCLHLRGVEIKQLQGFKHDPQAGRLGRLLGMRVVGFDRVIVGFNGSIIEFDGAEHQRLEAGARSKARMQLRGVFKIRQCERQQKYIAYGSGVKGAVKCRVDVEAFKFGHRREYVYDGLQVFVGLPSAGGKVKSTNVLREMRALHEERGEPGRRAVRFIVEGDPVEDVGLARAHERMRDYGTRSKGLVCVRDFVNDPWILDQVGVAHDGIDNCIDEFLRQNVAESRKGNAVVLTNPGRRKVAQGKVSPHETYGDCTRRLAEYSRLTPKAFEQFLRRTKSSNFQATSMPVDPDAPGRKSVFKINTDKHPYSQNTIEACIYCQRKRRDGESPLQICSGCKTVRFCNREHQVAFWPQHKAFCKEATKMQTLQDEAEKLLPRKALGLPTLRYQVRLVEDWAEIHRYTLTQAMAGKFHMSDPPIDFRSQCFEFQLKFRPEREGNPSTSFVLVSADVRRILDHPGASNMATMLPEIENAHAEERASGTKGFLGIFLCLYQIDNSQLWVTACAIYAHDIAPVRPSDRPWYWFPKYCAHFGLAFRRVGPPPSPQKPGLMGKESNKWVWKERTLEELAAQGIASSKVAV